jgi:uncharacterized glyoxalase superfamily protein PhnB
VVFLVRRTQQGQAGAVESYKAAFGAAEDYRVGDSDDGQVVIAQLSVGNASFWVADESPPHHNFSPDGRAGCGRGAIEISSVGEEHGWRLA